MTAVKTLNSFTSPLFCRFSANTAHYDRPSICSVFSLTQKPYDPFPVPPSCVWHLRRLLYLWVRSETINQSSLTLNLDRSRPVFYVLQSPSLTDLAVVDTECTKAGLPRPVLPVSVGPCWNPRRSST
jgi:hypothetical protein